MLAPTIISRQSLHPERWCFRCCLHLQLLTSKRYVSSHEDLATALHHIASCMVRRCENCCEAPSLASAVLRSLIWPMRTKIDSQMAILVFRKTCEEHVVVMTCA